MPTRLDTYAKLIAQAKPKTTTAPAKSVSQYNLQLAAQQAAAQAAARQAEQRRIAIQQQREREIQAARTAQAQATAQAAQRAQQQAALQAMQRQAAQRSAVNTQQYTPQASSPIVPMGQYSGGYKPITAIAPGIVSNTNAATAKAISAPTKFGDINGFGVNKNAIQKIMDNAQNGVFGTQDFGKNTQKTVAKKPSNNDWMTAGNNMLQSISGQVNAPVGRNLGYEPRPGQYSTYAEYKKALAAYNEAKSSQQVSPGKPTSGFAVNPYEPRMGEFSDYNSYLNAMAKFNGDVTPAVIPKEKSYKEPYVKPTIPEYQIDNVMDSYGGGDIIDTLLASVASVPISMANLISGSTPDWIEQYIQKSLDGGLAYNPWGKSLAEKGITYFDTNSEPTYNGGQTLSEAEGGPRTTSKLQQFLGNAGYSSYMDIGNDIKAPSGQELMGEKKTFGGVAPQVPVYENSSVPYYNWFMGSPGVLNAEIIKRNELTGYPVMETLQNPNEAFNYTTIDIAGREVPVSKPDPNIIPKDISATALQSGVFMPETMSTYDLEENVDTAWPDVVDEGIINPQSQSTERYINSPGDLGDYTNFKPPVIKHDKSQAFLDFQKSLETTDPILGIDQTVSGPGDGLLTWIDSDGNTITGTQEEYDAWRQRMSTNEGDPVDEFPIEESPFPGAINPPDLNVSLSDAEVEQIITDATAMMDLQYQGAFDQMTTNEKENAIAADKQIAELTPNYQTAERDITQAAANAAAEWGTNLNSTGAYRSGHLGAGSADIMGKGVEGVNALQQEMNKRVFDVGASEKKINDDIASLRVSTQKEKDLAKTVNIITAKKDALANKISAVQMNFQNQLASSQDMQQWESLNQSMQKFMVDTDVMYKNLAMQEEMQRANLTQMTLQNQATRASLSQRSSAPYSTGLTPSQILANDRFNWDKYTWQYEQDQKSAEADMYQQIIAQLMSGQ